MASWLAMINYKLLIFCKREAATDLATIETDSEFNSYAKLRAMIY